MTSSETETKVMDIIEKAAPKQLTEDQIRSRWLEADMPSAEKKRLIEEAVNNLFNQGKIGRDLPPAKLFVYFKKG